MAFTRFPWPLASEAGLSHWSGRLQLDIRPAAAARWCVPGFVGAVCNVDDSQILQGMDCVSAWNKGADSISMKFADGIPLFSERNQHHANQFSDFRSRSRGPDCRKRRSTRRYYPCNLGPVLVTARAGIQVATCPLCGSPSRRIHSRYVCEVLDLPCAGQSVRLRVVTRWFCCDTPHCRRIFAERLTRPCFSFDHTAPAGWTVSSIISVYARG